MSRDKIEEMAYHCLVTGHDFAKAIEPLELPIKPSFDLSYRSLLGKLKNGDILGKSDLFTVDQVGDILRAEMNAMRTGYLTLLTALQIRRKLLCCEYSGGEEVGVTFYLNRSRCLN